MFINENTINVLLKVVFNVECNNNPVIYFSKDVGILYVFENKLKP